MMKQTDQVAVMKLEIRGLQIEITDSLRRYARRSLGFALDRFAERICHLAISLAHASPINLETRASTVQGAIDRIAAKGRSLVERHLMRRYKQRRCRQHARKLLGEPVSEKATLRLREASES